MGGVGKTCNNENKSAVRTGESDTSGQITYNGV